MLSLVICFVAFVCAAPTRVQNKSAMLAIECQNNIAFTSPVAAGNTILIGVNANAGSAFLFNVSDNLGSAYSIVRSQGGADFTVTYFVQTLYMTTLTSGGSWTATICAPSDLFEGEMFAVEYSGISGVDVSAIDANLLSPPAGNFSTTAISASCPNELFFQYAVSLKGFLAPLLPMTQIELLRGNFIAERALSTTGTYRASFTATDSNPPGWVSITATFFGADAQCSAVAAGQTITLTGDVTVTSPVIDGTIIVNGNCTMPSPTLLGPSAVIRVTGNAVLSSSLTVTQGAQLVVGGSVTFSSGAVLLPVVTSIAPVVTITLANYTSQSGPVSVSSAVIAPTASSCASVTSSQPIVGSTSLTVVVSISTSACGTTAAAGGLSTGAIIGIAVGAGVGGALLIVSIILLIVSLRKRSDATANRAIRMKEVVL